MNASNGSRSRPILKHLLAEAGSSPAAVEKTLTELAARQELPAAHYDEIRAIRDLTQSMGDTAKNKTTLKLIRSVDDKIIVFVKYRATLDHLSDVLARHGIGHSVFYGQMPNARKDREIEKFKTDHNVLLTTELGGEGRNLQFCRRMINYDLPWNPMRIEQRIGRIHRIGQTREVLIYNLCAAGTVEDYILDILDRKINMFELVIGEIDMILGRMQGDRDFSDLVYDIWVGEASEESRKQAFDKLGTRLKRYKTGYEKTRSLDEKLFGENYEI
jgi:SNF2 family DNA or RNA helicase